MNLKITASAGTTDKTDVLITVGPNGGKGVHIDMESTVKDLFGDSIRETIEKVLKEFDVTDALVQVDDKGAYDFAIRARMRCALCRAAQIRYDWSKEDEIHA